jgi:hypothetical protein
MAREHQRDQLPSAGYQVNQNLATVVLLALAADLAVPLEVVHNQRDVAATPQKLPGEYSLAHRAQVEWRFEDAELTHRETFGLELNTQPCQERVRRANQIDVRVHRPDRTF